MSIPPLSWHGRKNSLLKGIDMIFLDHISIRRSRGLPRTFGNDRMRPLMAKRMFGTAGIRGVTNVEITPEMTLKIATAYGDWLVDQGKETPSVGIGYDTRYGAEVLARAAASGFASAGCNVIFYGCVPTGVYALGLDRDKTDGGILITGSHMPPDRIGIIACLGDGACAPIDITDQIEERYNAFPERTRVVPADKIGRIDEDFHAYERYVSEIIKMVDPRPIKEKKYRVLIDPANGAGSYIAKELFQWYGCDVEMIHFNPSPLPERPSEPRANTIRKAIEMVQKEKCDMGLCLDVDADRSVFIDAEGNPISEDTVGCLFAKEELKKGDLCVVPINSSGLIEAVCEEIGASLEYCQVGQPLTIKAVKEKGALFSYEESGKYYFARTQPWADGLYSGIKMLAMMQKHGKTLAELVAPLPVFHQVKHTVEVDDQKKEAAIEAAVKRMEDRITEGKLRDTTIDGFKRSFDDHSWLLLRKSGTEPLVRVYSDAPSLERAEALVREGSAVLKDALNDLD